MIKAFKKKNKKQPMEGEVLLSRKKRMEAVEILQTKLIIETSMKMLNHVVNQTLKSMPAKSVKDIHFISPYVAQSVCADQGKFDYYAAVITYITPAINNI